MNKTYMETCSESCGEMMAEPMSEATEPMSGQFRVCITSRSIQDAAMELSATLTEEGEPLLILDACGCFDPSRISRCAPHAAGLLHIHRASTLQPIVETMDEIWSSFQGAQRDLQSRQILVVGLLDRLYDPEILTRDAARTLGGIKYKLEQLAKDGFDVTVLCESPTGNLGTRAHFLSSLCASADQVSSPRSN
jgi:hypothetical protein